MPVHLVLPHDLSLLHHAPDKAVVGGYGVTVGVVLHEVAQEADTIALCVETSSVSSLYVPATSFIDIPISSNQKARIRKNIITIIIIIILTTTIAAVIWLGKASKQKSNLGFWLKLGGEGSEWVLGAQPVIRSAY